MGFLNGRVTYVRYRIESVSPLPFSEEHLELSRQHAIGRHGAADTTDGVQIGWAGGDHVLDLTFELTKNVLNDALHLALRVDTDRIPADLLRAYTRIETDSRARLNPSGYPTKGQREEAKEAARIRAEAEAADGRFRRMKRYPILWDGRTNVLYVGTTSPAILERLCKLFRETFDRALEPITAGRLASTQAQARGLLRVVEESNPVGFFGDQAESATVAWADANPSGPDFWGNEFLIWLWHTLQSDGDTLILPDGSAATVMLAKTLTLDCPRGETGRDNLTDEGPTRLPEAFRALQAGKLPRRVGLIIVRHGAEYELTLQAETFAVSGASLPKAEGASGREAQLARIDSLRHLVETLDLLYDAYVHRRTGPEWLGELSRIRRWLQAA
jgi:recombination associated protein RdgC